jgi:hypothetical protein
MATTLRSPRVGAAAVERLAPLAGVATLLLGAAGLIVLEGPADRPEADAAPRVMFAYFADRDDVILGSFLLALSVVAFMWFLGSLYAALRSAEGGTGRLSTVAYGGGLATAVLMLALPAASVLGALYADYLSAAEARTLFLVGDMLIYPAAVTAAVLTSATGLVALRSGALARWMAWLSLALAVWLLIPPFGGTPENPVGWTGLAALGALPLWIAVLAILLVRRHSRRAAPGSRRDQ